jgi:hypothetical protein
MARPCRRIAAAAVFLVALMALAGGADAARSAPRAARGPGPSLLRRLLGVARHGGYEDSGDMQPFAQMAAQVRESAGDSQRGPLQAAGRWGRNAAAGRRGSGAGACAWRRGGQHAGAPAACPPPCTCGVPAHCPHPARTRAPSQDAVRRAVDGNSPYGAWGAAQSAQSSAIAATNYGERYGMFNQQRFGGYGGYGSYGGGYY